MRVAHEERLLGRLDETVQVGEAVGLADPEPLEDAEDVLRRWEDVLRRLETDPETLEPAPYVLVRDGLEARLSRPVFYELAEMAEAYEGSAGQLGVWSQGLFFELGPAA